MGEFLFWAVIIVILSVANLLIFKFSGSNREKRVRGGKILLLLSPIVYFACILIGSLMEWGFGTGALAVIYTFLFVVNGLIILIIAFFSNKSASNQ